MDDKKKVNTKMTFHKETSPNLCYAVKVDVPAGPEEDDISDFVNDYWNEWEWEWVERQIDHMDTELTDKEGNLYFHATG